MAEHAFDLHTTPLEAGIHAIEASAGTGKTYTLAQLVVRLVVEKRIPIEQILTVTFTRAAAAELRERIFNRLSEVLNLLSGGTNEDAALQTWIAHLPDVQDARTALLQARLMLDQAPIHTIDAFAIQVVREHALSLGLPWDATLLEDSRRMEQQLTDTLWHTLSELPEPIQQAILSQWPSPDALYERFRDLGPLARFDDVPDWRTLWQQREEELAQWPPDRLQAMAYPLEAHVQKGCKKKSLEKCRRMILEPLSQGQLPQMEDNATLLAYLNQSLRKAAPLSQLPSELHAELEALDATLCTLPDPVQMAQAWFAETFERWKTLRQQALNSQGLFTYESLKHALAQAVRQQHALRQQLQDSYQVCLIDEFQDTDPDQWALFSTLFGQDDRHALFLIGDPKQAIYGFRGANLLTYFKALDSASHRYTLTTNYRSHPRLVEGFNVLFGDQADASAFLDPRCSAPSLKSARSAEETALYLNGAPCNIIRILQGHQLQDVAEATLARLCQDMIRMLEQGERIEQGERRPVQPGDMVVLVKSNEDALAVQQALRQAGIPSVLTSRTSVWESDSAMALIQLLQALTQPRQHALIRAVLLGPFFHYSLAQLDDEALFTRFQNQFEDALQRWEKGGVLSALLTLFEQAGSWARLASLPDGDRRIADTRHLLELMHQQAHLANLSPQALLRWAIQQHAGTTGSDAHTLRLERDDDAVELVTMHSAKGLEYPIVFVYGAWKQGQVQSKPFPIALPTPEGTRASFDPEDKKALMEQERQELRRLFYVACTRAISHLTLYWPNADKVPKKQQTWQDALNGLLRPRLQQLLAHPAFQFETYDEDIPPRQWSPPLKPISLEAPPSVDFSTLKQRSRILTSYSGLTRLSHRETHLERWLEEDDTPLIEDDPLPAGAAFGKLVHDFLEQCDFARPDWTPLKTRWLNFPGGSHDNWPALKALIENTLQADCQPFSLQCLAPSQIWREYHFVLHAPALNTSMLNDLMRERPDWQPVEAEQLRGYLQGFIDLIAEVDGCYYIVDYKTNQLAQYDPDTLTEAMRQHHYTLQALLYTLALDAHLRAFKPDYAPHRYLGGARYLFMRGMRTGKSTGLYTVTFPPEQIEAVRMVLTGETP